MRIITLTVSLVTAIIVIVLLARVLPPGAAAIMLDIKRSSWPFTVQNILWLAFFVGLGELSIRWRAGRLEESQIERNYLPEDEETVLRPGDDITPIYQKVRASKYREICFVPRLIERCVLGFNLSHSADQTNSLLNSSLELYLHEIDPQLRRRPGQRGESGYALPDYRASWCCIQYHAARAGDGSNPGVYPEPGAGAGGKCAEQGRTVLPGQPDQPPLRPLALMRGFRQLSLIPVWFTWLLLAAVSVLAQAPNQQILSQADFMPAWTVPVLRLVSATHVEPTTGVVISESGLVMVPVEFASFGDEIIVLDGGTDIIRNGRPAPKASRCCRSGRFDAKVSASRPPP
jgi:hypothetical protein